MIKTLNHYVEPPKEVKEAKGDIRDLNRYNFKELMGVGDEEEEEPVEQNNDEKEVRAVQKGR